jgi:hypothetical protein
MKTLTRLALLLLAAHAVSAQDSIPGIRVATYQLESYAAPLPARDAALHGVLRAIHPDILLVQGIASTAAFDNFFGSAFLGTTTRSMSAPFNGSTGNALFYNAAGVALVEHRVLQTSPVGIDEFIVTPRGSADTIHIFTCGLDRMASREKSAERLAAAGAILERTGALPKGHHFIFAGDLHPHAGDDPAYTALLAETVAGSFSDPLAPIADWRGESTYAPSGGHGDAGRFDMILLSRSMALHYVAASYTTPGGAAHGDATMTSAAMKESLRRASAHLPVFADFTFRPAAAPPPFTPLQTTRLALPIQQRRSAFARPEPHPTDFGGIMLQKSLEEPKLDIFGTTFGLGSAQENQRRNSHVNGKWWGPPPGAPDAPAGRSSHPEDQ